MERNVNCCRHRGAAAAAAMAFAVLCGCLHAGCFDFETGDLQGWRVVEGGFGKIVTDLAREHNRKIPYSKGGVYFLSTLETKSNAPNDGFVGVVESPCVRLTGPAISFRIGGGNKCRFMLVDRATFRTLREARGNNDERMRIELWNVPEAVGSNVFFRVEDYENGGWSHITIDDVAFMGDVDKTDDFGARCADREAREPIEPAALANAEAAIRELGAKYPEYPAADFLAELAAFRGKGGKKALNDLLVKVLVRSNPIVNAHEIAFVTRAQYRGDHHNTATMFQCGEVNHHSYCTQGALKAYDPKTGAVRVIVPEESGRTVRDPEVDYEGRRIVFSMRMGKNENYHVWRVNADGTDLKQLTSAANVTDIDPVWLPDGDILFSSTREPKYCMCNRHIMCNLYRMKPDGANIHQIGKSTLFEGHSTILPDGRVLYDRWEYVDRDFGDAQGLWVCNQDGTRHAIYWGNNTTSPGGVINARALSDSSRVIAVLGSCHDRPWGALGIIDRTLGVDGPRPVLRTWPADYRAKIHAEGEDFDSTRPIARKYADPFPLDDEHFLCAKQTARGEEMALVYLDMHGNEVFFHEEDPGCHTPIVLRPSAKPPVQACQRNFAAPDAPGFFYVQNVYNGTHMKGVEKGAVKAIRVVESPEKRSFSGPGWFGHGEEAPVMNWHSFENKRILGTVPVEADGSAYFEVPGNTFVYFQALDGEGKMVQSMRSGVIVQPGELYGCVGCHEDRVKEVPKSESKVLAMRRAPSRLDGSYNLRGLEKGTSPHLYSFQKEVQGVFTRNCLKCHDYGGKAAAKLNLAGDRGMFFCTSYTDLWALGAIRCIGGGPAEIQPAYSWGAHASKLTKTLYGHGGVSLSADDRDRVITWMDVNAPYWPVYECTYSANRGGRQPFTKEEYARLEKLTGRTIAYSHSAKQREQVSFDRPELSRILDGVRGKPEHAEALALIRLGAERLKKLPRADMDGFKFRGQDVAWDRRYNDRRAKECAIYGAIRDGKKIYDAK